MELTHLAEVPEVVPAVVEAAGARAHAAAKAATSAPSAIAEIDGSGLVTGGLDRATERDSVGRRNEWLEEESGADDDVIELHGDGRMLEGC